MAKEISDTGYKPYHLVRAKNNQIYTRASYCKYFANAAYIAVIDSYLDSDTRVTVCRYLPPENTGFGYNRVILFSTGLDGTRRKVGQFQILGTVHSEDEAIDFVAKNGSGTEAFIAAAQKVFAKSGLQAVTGAQDIKSGTDTGTVDSEAQSSEELNVSGRTYRNPEIPAPPQIPATEYHTRRPIIQFVPNGNNKNGE